jgi:hypothetical protein
LSMAHASFILGDRHWVYSAVTDLGRFHNAVGSVAAVRSFSW